MEFPSLLTCASTGDMPSGFLAFFGDYGSAPSAMLVLTGILVMAYSKPKTTCFLCGQLTMNVAALLAIAPVLNMITVAMFGMPLNCDDQRIAQALHYGHILAWIASLAVCIGLVVTVLELLSVSGKRSVRG